MEPHQCDNPQEGDIKLACGCMLIAHLEAGAVDTMQQGQNKWHNNVCYI